MICINDLKEPMAAAIASVEVVTKTDENGKMVSTKVRLLNKTKSLSDLANTLGCSRKTISRKNCLATPMN